jgi:hypothetical protein
VQSFDVMDASSACGGLSMTITAAFCMETISEMASRVREKDPEVLKMILGWNRQDTLISKMDSD